MQNSQDEFLTCETAGLWKSGLCKACYPDNPPRWSPVGYPSGVSGGEGYKWQLMSGYPTHYQPSGHINISRVVTQTADASEVTLDQSDPTAVVIMQFENTPRLSEPQERPHCSKCCVNESP